MQENTNNATPTTLDPNRLNKVSSILVTQSAQETTNNAYLELARKYNIKIDFRPFIETQPLSLQEFRKQKINLLDYGAVIFTSKKAVEHFFALCKSSRVEMPADTKYFCVSEQTANYLQKFIVIRKRKIFSGEKTAVDLFPLLKKHKAEKFLFPCSQVRKDEIPEYLTKNGYQFSEMILYKTVSSDLSDLADVNYDALVFYSPSGVQSLYDNFPDFKQNNTRIAAFGPTTAAAVRNAGLILDIEAPLPNAPSMTGALEAYIKLANGIVADVKKEITQPDTAS
jgi:uroporphyrinogen-III synthase